MEPGGDPQGFSKVLPCHAERPVPRNEVEWGSEASPYIGPETLRYPVKRGETALRVTVAQAGDRSCSDHFLIERPNHRPLFVDGVRTASSEAKFDPTVDKYIIMIYISL